jgi:hypothetical protein
MNVVSMARMSAAWEDQGADYNTVVLAVVNPCGCSQRVLGSANFNRAGLQTPGTQYNQRANVFHKTTNVFWYVCDGNTLIYIETIELECIPTYLTFN